MIRVVVADDEAMVRAGIRAILATDPDIDVVAEAGDGHQAVELVRSHRPDVALLDIRMPRLDGLAAAAEIRRLVPDTAVVMLTTFGEDAYVAGALANGANGFLLKAGDPRELLAAVHAVTGGAAYLSPKIAHRVIAQLTGTSYARGEQARVRSRRSPTGNGRCWPCWGRACPTPRSPGGCTWSREPSRATSARSSPGSRPRTACRPRSSPTRAGLVDRDR